MLWDGNGGERNKHRVGWAMASYAVYAHLTAHKYASKVTIAMIYMRDNALWPLQASRVAACAAFDGKVTATSPAPRGLGDAESTVCDSHPSVMSPHTTTHPAHITLKLHACASISRVAAVLAAQYQLHALLNAKNAEMGCSTVQHCSHAWLSQLATLSTYMPASLGATMTRPMVKDAGLVGAWPCLHNLCPAVGCCWTVQQSRPCELLHVLST